MSTDRFSFLRGEEIEHRYHSDGRALWMGRRKAKPPQGDRDLSRRRHPRDLTQPHYLEGVAKLGPEVWCVTLDIPGHGTEALPDEPGGLSTWRHRLEKNTPFLADYTARASSVIDHWVERRFTDPNKIGIFGTSRGGTLAFQLAAADPRIRYIAAFAPVTELLALSEFSGMKDDHSARGASAVRLADALRDRGIWMIIGTTDYRVGTRDTIAFTERLLEAAAAHGFRPRVELHLEPTVGHRVPGGSYPRAADWMLGQFNRGE